MPDQQQPPSPAPAAAGPAEVLDVPFTFDPLRCNHEGKPPERCPSTACLRHQVVRLREVNAVLLQTCRDTLDDYWARWAEVDCHSASNIRREVERMEDVIAKATLPAPAPAPASEGVRYFTDGLRDAGVWRFFPDGKGEWTSKSSGGVWKPATCTLSEMRGQGIGPLTPSQAAALLDPVPPMPEGDGEAFPEGEWYAADNINAYLGMWHVAPGGKVRFLRTDGTWNEDPVPDDRETILALGIPRLPDAEARARWQALTRK